MVDRNAHHRPSIARKGAMLIIVFALALTTALLPGCLPSDTITEIIYDLNENSLQRDDAPTTLTNDIEAQEQSEVLPELTADEDSEEYEQTEQNLPANGETQTDAPAPQPEYEQDSTDNGQSSNQASSDSDAPDERNAGETTEEDSDDKGTKSDSGDGMNDDEQGGNNNDSTGEDKTDSGSGKKADNNTQVYADYGDAPEIPEGVHKVTAVGQGAVIVSIMAGSDDETPLVGADAELLDNANAQKVLAGKGIGQVPALWSGDGASGDLTSVEALVEASPDLCFVLEGDETFTDEQEQELLDQGISIYVLPALTSARNIDYAMRIVSKVFEKGGYDTAAAAYDSYASWNSGLVDKVKSLNGGLAGGFDYDTGKSVSSSDTTLYTLFISDWDYDARYADENAGYLSSANGAGVCPLSYKSSPLSYYLSMGGVVNNAAYGPWKSTSLSGQRAVAWQFSQTMCPSDFRLWATLDREKATYAPTGGNGLDLALMWNSVDQIGLGTDAFPGVIVASEEMRDALVLDAGRSNGIYHPYPVTTTTEGANISGVGYVNGDTLVRSGIGTYDSGEGSVFYGGESGKTLYDIHVNPHGLFSSWTEGSVESVLEAPWAYQAFHDETYDLQADVRDFYQVVYGYELSDEEYQAIVDGTV